MDIIKPSTADSSNLGENEGIVLDASLIERVFITHIFTVKNIPLNCHLSFSRALKDALLKVVDDLGYVDTWVWLLLFLRCTLQAVKPHNMRDRRSRNQKALQ